MIEGVNISKISKEDCDSNVMHFDAAISIDGSNLMK